MEEDNKDSSFSLFFTENRERFLSFTFSFVRNRMVAEDILMDAVATFWENRDNWNDSSNYHALFFTLIKRRALNYLAHEQVAMQAESNISSLKNKELELRIASLESCNPEKLFSTEIQSLVRKALQKLSPQSRQIYLLSRSETITNKQIATTLNLSEKSVEYHITKVLKILRHELKDYF